jgi:hypothetical protein
LEGKIIQKKAIYASLLTQLFFELTLLPFMEIKSGTENEEIIVVAWIKTCLALLRVLNACILLKIII